MIHFGVIGCGQWGPNHVRNFSHLADSRVLMCADLNEARLKVMKDTFRSIHPTTDYKEILAHPKIDAVVIATPTSTHYPLVRQCLLAGKDVLCEKPLCLKVDEARELAALAHRKKRILMIGHVFLFNSGIRWVREMVRAGQCGRIYYMHSERTNLGPFRTDVNAVWDLAAHDVAIFNYFLNAKPVEVSARGGKYLQQRLEDVAFISLIYPRNVLVNIHVSWLDPRKVRQITVVGDKKMVIWDDMDNVGPVKIYDRQVVKRNYYETFGEFHLLAKEGSITMPKIDLYEPLKTQDKHFLECVRDRKTPIADAQSAVDAVMVLSGIQESLKKRGGPVTLR